MEKSYTIVQDIIFNIYMNVYISWCRDWLTVSVQDGICSLPLSLAVCEIISTPFLPFFASFFALRTDFLAFYSSNSVLYVLPVTETSCRALYLYTSCVTYAGVVTLDLDGSSADISTTLASGEWHHIALTAVPSGVRVFVNGSETSSGVLAFTDIADFQVRKEHTNRAGHRASHEAGL